MSADFQESTGDMDPEAAARFATGESGGSGAELGGSSGPFDRLFDGSAQGPTVGEVEMDYGFSKPWATFTRGCVRTATGEGVPPIAEIVIGGALGIVKLSRGEGDDEENLGEIEIEGSDSDTADE